MKFLNRNNNTYTLKENCDYWKICLKKAFLSYERRILAPTKKEAAILVPLFFQNDKIHIILTKRSKHLLYHSGEVSFPGGSKDNSDKTKLDTALRETEEEINLSRKYIDILGKLDDQYSVTNISVTPFVGVVTDVSAIDSLKPQESEVEEIFSVPLDFFYKNETYWQEIWIRHNAEHEVYFYNYKGRIIWGLTGQTIKNLLTILGICKTCHTIQNQHDLTLSK